MFLLGTPEWVKFTVFLIVLDPGCPEDPKVGPHSDCMVSWDTVGGIQALGCLQGPQQMGLGSHKMVPWRFWQFCKANLAGKW